ncbi:MAG: OmpA family protein [Bacteroidota bacterium]
MRFLLVICCYFYLLSIASAQNLVPNPSFERTNEITDRWMGTFSKFNRAMKFWNSPTQGSPDLLFLKVKDRMFPPRNGFDLTPYFPRSGKMMLGMKTYGCEGQVMHCKEYLQVKFKRPLEIGEAYYIEFYVNPLYTAILTNNIGAAVSTSHTYQLYAEGLYDFEPKINVSEVLGYTEKWHKISGTFVADSSYQYLLIGNFKRDSETQIDSSNASIDYGFVLVDDIRFVRADQKDLSFAEELDLGSIQFEWDKSVLLDTAYPVLEQVLIMLKRDETVRIRIIGHTDATGTPEYNINLSTARAKRVQDYLIAKGIAAERLEFIGRGEEKPIATNGSEVGRQANRRVEFEVVDF